MKDFNLRQAPANDNPTKAQRSVVSAAMVVIFLLCTIGCDRSRSETTLKLGAIFPLTGDIASYGIAAKRGIDLAVEESTVRYGLQGKRITVIFEDDQGQPNRAIPAMEKLVAVDKVPAVMGSAASSVTLALCPIATRTKVVLMSPISSSEELTQKGGPFFFRVCPSDVVQARMMAEWITGDGRKRAALLYVNNAWGQGLRAEFLTAFRSQGGSVVAEETIKEGDRDFRSQITKILAARPDALYAVTHGREGGALLRQIKQLALVVPIYGADVWGSPELIQTAGDAASGVRIIVPATFGGALYAAFASAFERKYGVPPETYASYSYDMANILISALQGTAPGNSVKDTIASRTFDGVTGTTKFDEHGDVLGKGFERKVLP